MKNKIVNLLAFAAVWLACCNLHASLLVQWGLDQGTTSADQTTFTTATGISASGTSLNFLSPTGGSFGANTSGGAAGGGSDGFLAVTGSSIQVNGTTFTFVIAAANSYQISLTSLTFDILEPGGKPPTAIDWIYTSGTGNASTALNGNGSHWTTGVTNNLAITLNSGQSVTITGTLLDTATQTQAGAGNIDFDDFTINGTATVVPEPVTHALPLFGLVLISGMAGRKL